MVSSRGPLPDQARVVIVGGGVGGASIAYHLAQLGWTDIVLVERADVASGTTFHSAGNVGQLRSTATQTRMMARDGIGLFRRLMDETGVDPGWHEVGSVRIASTKPRAEELRRQADMALALGLEMALLTPREAVDRFPLMSSEGIVAAGQLLSDGWIDPSGLTMALLAGARARGVAVQPHTNVTGIGLRRGRIASVRTNRGTIKSEIVVNAAGMYAPEVGRLVDLDIPIVAMEHQYLITEPINGMDPTWPVVRDTDNLCYFRPETGGLLVGGFERNPVPWGIDGIPADFNARLLAPDWPRFEEIMPGAMRRLPVLATAGISTMVNGPDAFTPDGEFVLGETDVPGFWVAAGFCSHGIALAPAIGKQMAYWLVEGQPEFDLSAMDARRFGPAYRSRRYVIDRTVEVAGAYFALHAPGEERAAGRPLRTSSAYPRLVALGASFGEKAGWERPNWFARNEPDGDDALKPPGLAGREWSAAIDAEARATRATAGLFDMSSFTKILVHGRGALGLLQRLCANDVDRPPGSVVYTQLLNDRGGIECDLTVTRMDAHRFLLVTGTGAGVHDLAWLRRHARGASRVTVDEVTSSRACFGLWGPASRAIVSSLSPDDVSNDAFPYLTAREIVIGTVPVMAVRVTNVGELGWELYAPTEFGLALWDWLWEAGTAQGLVAAGYRAAEALRLEKGYRAWPGEISPEDTPYEAGLGFAIRLNKVGGFIGREALTGTDPRSVGRRLRCLVVDGPPVPIVGNEPLRLGGRVVGRVRSAGFGYTVKRTIAYGYLPQPEGSVGAEAEIGVLGEWLPATVVSEPIFDPAGARVRG